jgi:hypothetical protein
VLWHVIYFEIGYSRGVQWQMYFNAHIIQRVFFFTAELKMAEWGSVIICYAAK